MPGIYENIMRAERLLDECYDLETGEVDEEKEAKLAAAKDALIAEGLESLCNLRADKLAYISGLDAEAARITDKAKAEKKKTCRPRRFYSADTPEIRQRQINRRQLDGRYAQVRAGQNYRPGFQRPAVLCYQADFPAG